MTAAPRLLTSLVWGCVRLPILVFLVTVEPVVAFVVAPLALLGILMTLFWWSLGVPHFRFLLMLGVSLCIGAIPVAYQAVLRLLAR